MTVATNEGNRLTSIAREDPPPEEAAKNAADPHRLLEGEDPSTPHPQEAQHWVEVYTELLTFKERTLATTDRNLAAMPEKTAREEAKNTDMVVLKAERERLRQRLDFWERRHRELTAE